MPRQNFLFLLFKEDKKVDQVNLLRYLLNKLMIKNINKVKVGKVDLLMDLKN